MRSFDYLVDTDELDGVILYNSDNEAITDDPVKTVTNEAFHVSEKPHAHAHIFTAGGVKTYLQNKAVFWHLNSHVVNQNFHVIFCSCTCKAF